MPATGDADLVFVDLSNVSKDASLGASENHAALHRWERLRAEWLRVRGRADFVLVADRSLLTALSRVEQARLNALVSAGQAMIVDDADTEVLRRAMATEGYALSNDRFVDHRRLQGLQKAHLVGWVARGDGIRFQERSLARLLSVLVSRRADKQALKELGLQEDSTLLQRKWFCRNAGCNRDLVASPRVVRDAPTCPACGGFLEAGDTWRVPLWLKVLHGDVELLRTVLEDGEHLILGNGTDGATLPLASGAASQPDVLRLSDRHAEFANVDGHLLVTDLGSAHGTSIRLPAARERNLLLPPGPLLSHQPTLVPAGAKVVLARTRITCQLSGSRTQT